MTREEKIAELVNIRDNFNYTLAPREVFDDAIKALEQETCEDAISRQAVLDEMYKRKANGDAITAGFIKNLKSVTLQPKTGHWITKDGKEQGYDIGGVKTWYIQIMCSECGFIKTAIEGHTGQYHYCPNCGVRMIEPQTESEDKDEQFS